MRFQSTLPQGERHAQPYSTQWRRLFQSTLPQGERLRLYKSFTGDTKFQSTLPQGERPTARHCRRTPAGDFNPRSHKGSDGEAYSMEPDGDDFNPRSHKGSDCHEKSLPEHHRYFNPRSHKGSDSNYNQISHSTFIQNYHFLLHCLPSSIPKLSFPRYLTILCAIFPVRIPHRFYVCFRFAPGYKINVWSAAVPRSTPICSTFVWYLFPR